MPPVSSRHFRDLSQIPSFPGRFTLLKQAVIRAFKQTFNSVIDFAGELSKKKISVYASSTSYFLFSSIPPFIILMSMLLPRFGLSVSELVKMVTDITPDDLDYQVTLIIQDAFARSGSVVPLTLVFMIWTAANSIAALSEGLRVAYGVRRQQRFLAFRLLSIVYTFSVILLLAAYMLISMFGEKIMGLIGWNKLKLPKILMMVLNWHNLFFLLVGFTMVLFMYVFLSGRKLSIRYHVFGTIFTIIAWELFSVIFSAYLKLSTNRSVIYGSFSALVALLLWIYIAICILLAGGVLNQHIHREDDLEEAELRRARRRARTSLLEDPPSEKTTSKRPTSERTTSARRHLERTTSERPPSERPTSARLTSERTTSARLSSEKLTSGRPTSARRPSERPASERNPSERPTSERPERTVTADLPEKLANALTDFWFNEVGSNWNRSVVKWWNEPSTKERLASIKYFWNNVIVRKWNDVVINKIIHPLSNQLGRFMENFRHFDNDE